MPPVVLPADVEEEVEWVVRPFDRDVTRLGGREGYSAVEQPLFLQQGQRLVPAKGAAFAARQDDRGEPHVKSSFAPATASTSPRSWSSADCGSRRTPSQTPSSAPALTAARSSGISAGTLPRLATLPASPAAELVRMKAAATPEVARGFSQPRSRMSGLRKMPPPVPVRPASRPSTAPAGRLIQSGGVWTGRSAMALGFHSRRKAAHHRTMPTSGL